MHKSFVYTQFKYLIVRFDPYIGPYKVQPLQGRVDQEVMAIKGYSQSSRITRATTSDCLVSYHDTRWGSLTLLCQFCCDIMTQMVTHLKSWWSLGFSWFFFSISLSLSVSALCRSSRLYQCPHKAGEYQSFLVSNHWYVPE